MSSTYHIVIPARFGASRLPGKPLADLAGETLIARVWQQARKANADSITIATDHEEIAAEADRIGADWLMTREDHPSGTDRLAEVAAAKGWDDATIVVNLQGDEPLMPAVCLDQVAGLAAQHPDAAAASLCTPVDDPGQMADPDVVKVVLDNQGYALYFSRAAIPFERSGPISHYRHIGLYAYRVATLEWFARAERGQLEAAESLEQLRLLEAGRRIIMAAAVEPVPGGVDNVRDLQYLQKYFT